MREKDCRFDLGFNLCH